jgi:rhamnosyltransferase
MMIRKPKVLILLATYNGGQWLEEQIQSIFAQEGVDIKIYARDDRSFDNTCKILSAYPGLTKLESNYSTGSAGGNFRELIINANTDDFDFIGFSDQDDIWLSTKVISAINLIVGGAYQGYSSSVLAFGSSGTTKLIKQCNIERRADFLFEGAGQGCTFLLEKEFFLSIQKFVSENKVICSNFYYHDWLVYLLARSWGKKWIFDAIPYVSYRQHDNNDTGSRNRVSGIVARLNKIKNGWYKEQVIVAIKIYELAVNNRDDIVDNFIYYFNNKNSFYRKYLIIMALLKHGRRKLSDRFVLIGAVLFGYI